MNLYIKSSAVLSWLFGERRSSGIRQILIEAELLISSDLTLVECDGAIHRAVEVNAISEPDRARLRSHLATAVRNWIIFHVTGEIVARARQAFPEDPVRTLGAPHMASALAGRSAVRDLKLLTLDERVRKIRNALDFGLVPI
jgi:hypothetical protein